MTKLVEELNRFLELSERKLSDQISNVVLDGLAFCHLGYRLRPTMPKSPDPRWRAEMQKQALEVRKRLERHLEIVRASQVLIEKTNELIKQTRTH